MLPNGTPFYNKAKHLLKDGGKLIGAWAQLASPMAAEIMARAGFDFLLIDMEHAPGDFMVLTSQLQAISAFGTVPIVRTPWNDFVAIKRTLDAGAYGIHVPYVNTAEETRQAVRASKYQPEGFRGIAGSPRACGYGMSNGDYFKYANQETLVYISLETPEAIDNLDAIMAVDGLDGIFIGPMDLSTSMGYMGNPGHPEVQKVIRGVEKKIVGSGKFLGTVAGDYDAARELFGRGYQYVVAMSDSIELSRRSRQMVQAFQADFQ